VRGRISHGLEAPWLDLGRAVVWQRAQDRWRAKCVRHGGIRLLYLTLTEPVEDLKEGVLLEAGFDVVAPGRLASNGSDCARIYADWCNSKVEFVVFNWNNYNAKVSTSLE
jgi:hypothetical protein